MASCVEEQPPSYEDVLNHHGLSSEQMLAKVPEEALSAIAKEMTGWRNIELELPSHKASDLKRENGSDDQEKRREYLQCWWQTFGHRATFEALTRRFIGSGRCDLADLVCEQLRLQVEHDLADSTEAVHRTSSHSSSVDREMQFSSSSPNAPTDVGSLPKIHEELLEIMMMEEEDRLTAQVQALRELLSRTKMKCEELDKQSKEIQSKLDAHAVVVETLEKGAMQSGAGRDSRTESVLSEMVCSLTKKLKDVDHEKIVTLKDQTTIEKFLSQKTTSTAKDYTTMHVSLAIFVGFGFGVGVVLSRV